MAQKINGIELYKDFNGGCKISFLIDEQQAETVQDAVCRANERLKQGKMYELDFHEVKNRRSLDANAYFHVLVDKIAKATRQGADTVKDELVLSYGAVLTYCKLPPAVDVSIVSRYARLIDETSEDKTYILYKPTHLLDTGEMSTLIDGTVAEAKDLGIETLTPTELEKIKNTWR